MRTAVREVETMATRDRIRIPAYCFTVYRFYVCARNEVKWDITDIPLP